jgi:hypothetical protein
MPRLVPGFLLVIAVSANGLTAGEISLPAGANSWVFDASGTCIPSQAVADDGIKRWSDAAQKIRTYFWIGQPGALDLRLKAAVTSGRSKIRCTVGRVAKEVTITNAHPESIVIGTFTIAQPGYQYLELQGISRTAATFATITHLELSGTATGGAVHFLKDDFHFGRRGPSVHLNYRLPKEARDIRYFYNEVSVPVGKDVIGTYCMANGFGEGYSGMQVNSTKERRILFSVWSPFSTDDPKKIPESDRIALLVKGKEVQAQAFGGEGSGGQSFLVYPWKAGNVYKFLLRGEPGGDGTTTYTCYFFPPEQGRWRLIASFRRPKTSTYLTRWHSFLENFSTDTGAITREGNYTNQWACDKDGHWFEAIEASFTADATAQKNARLDYTGGTTDDGRFFLRNCGFFSEHRACNTTISRKPGRQPVVDFAALPKE